LLGRHGLRHVERTAARESWSISGEKESPSCSISLFLRNPGRKPLYTFAEIALARLRDAVQRFQEYGRKALEPLATEKCRNT
jgi:hypothetical protein